MNLQSNMKKESNTEYNAKINLQKEMNAECRAKSIIWIQLIMVVRLNLRIIIPPHQADLTTL